MKYDSYLRCKYCREKIKGDETYCPNCGAPLDAGSMERIEIPVEEPEVIREKPKKQYEKPKPEYKRPQMPKSTLKRVAPGYDWTKSPFPEWMTKPRKRVKPWIKRLMMTLLILLVLGHVADWFLSNENFRSLFSWASDTVQNISRNGAYEELMESLPFPYIPKDLGTETQDSYAIKLSEKRYEFWEFGFQNDFLTVCEKTEYFLCPEDQEELLLLELQKEPGDWESQEHATVTMDRAGGYLRITSRAEHLEDSQNFRMALFHRIMPLGKKGEDPFFRSGEIREQMLFREYCLK